MNQFPLAVIAPPLSDAKLARYKALTHAAPPGESKDAMERCLACVERWWGLPDSARQPTQRLAVVHGGKAMGYGVVPLEERHVAELDPLVPWMWELKGIGAIFGRLPEGTAEERDLRDCAHDLLWHATELCLDREPITTDKLGDAHA